MPRSCSGWLRFFGLIARQSFTAAALFLTFPANLEAVAWCAGIQDVLMTAGVLGANRRGVGIGDSALARRGGGVAALEGNRGGRAASHVAVESNALGARGRPHSASPAHTRPGASPPAGRGGLAAAPTSYK
jgi:hypothetical protein